MHLNNQRVVIIGGTSGIGLATARTLATAGAQVIIAGRQREKVTQALATIEEAATDEVVDATSREETTSFFRLFLPPKAAGGNKRGNWGPPKPRQEALHPLSWRVWGTPEVGDLQTWAGGPAPLESARMG